MGDRFGSPGATDKNHSRALSQEHASQAEYWVLEWARVCAAMNMAKSCKEGTAEIEENLGWEVTCSKLGSSKDY